MKSAYCFGLLSSKSIYSLHGLFPQVNGQGDIKAIDFTFSGEALTTSLILHSLGVKVCLEGNWIGDNAEGNRLFEFISNSQLNTPSLHIQKGFLGFVETVFVTDNSETVFDNKKDIFLNSRHWDLPTINEIVSSGVVSCDPDFVDVAFEISLLAKEYTIPFVGFNSRFDTWYSNRCNVLIITDYFLENEYPGQNKEEMFLKYSDNTSGLLIFILNSQTLWFGRCGINKMNFSCKSTANMIESFRAGIMYGILKNMSDLDMIQYAITVLETNTSKLL